MLEALDAAPADPIIGLSEAFRNDPNPDKINLSVGVYKDREGKTPVFAAVKEAERRLCGEEISKTYPPLDGVAGYGAAVRDLVFGAHHEVVATGRAATTETTGGTGALRLAAEFIRAKLPGRKVWLSIPTWPNHPGVFQAAGLATLEYPYYNAGSHKLDFSVMLEVLKTIPAGDIVVLHGCCHNPTGMDPAPEQWQAMAEVAAEAGWLPLFDFAYQGLADGIEQDAAGLRCFVNTVPEILVCSSFSKNFGLYAERAGALTVAAGDAEAAQKAHGHIKRCLRALHSFSPAHGGQLVRLVLDDPELRSSWEKELTEMRERINGMRSLLVQKLEAAGVEQDFSFIAGQRGMFSFPGLTKEQVARLRDEFSIYIVGSGRINVAGINEANIDRLVSAIQAVL